MFQLMNYEDPKIQKEMLRRQVADDTNFLKHRLFEDVMAFLHRRKMQCSALQAIIHSKDAPSMRRLKESPQFYINEKILVNITVFVGGDTSYYQKRDEFMETIKDAFIACMSEENNYNAVFLDFIFNPQTEELDIKLNVYQQTTENLIDETCQALQCLKNAPMDDIYWFLADQRSLFSKNL